MEEEEEEEEEGPSINVLCPIIVLLIIYRTESYM